MPIRSTLTPQQSPMHRQSLPNLPRGRMIRIVCPMCETPGFISSKMQGRDVKCHNKDCLVPIFKAPRPERKEEPVEEPRGWFSSTNLALGALVLVPLLLFLGWFFVLRESGPEKYVPNTNNTVTNDANPREDSEGTAEAPPAALPEESKTSLADLKRQALEQVVFAVRARDDNRSKPYCRRMAAQMFAQVGDLEQAQEHFFRLLALTPEKFYQAEPLAAIAWQQLESGSANEAGRTIAMASEAAVDFPSIGRAAPTSAISVAAVLAADGRIEEAKEVFARLDHDDDATLTRERVASLIKISSELEIFDLDRILRYSSMDMAVDPLGVATAITIAAHSNWDQSITWAMQANSIAAREDCMAAIALVAARHAALTQDQSAVTTVEKAAKQLSMTGQCRVSTGIATGYFMQGDKESAVAALNRALNQFEQIERPDAVPAPEIRSIVDGVTLPDPSPLQSAAVGAAQMARLLMLLGDESNAWNALRRSWEFTNGIGPSAESVFELVDEIADATDRAKARVSRELGLASGDVLNRLFRKYRRNARDIGESARTRFDLEVTLLREAITWGLLDNVEEVLRDPGAVIPTAAGQPYLTTSLPSTLARNYEMDGNTSKAEEITQLIPAKEEGQDHIAELIAATEASFRSQKPLEAATAIGRFSSRSQNLEERRDLRALQLACRLLKQKNPEELFAFIHALKDPQLMDDCFEMTAALSVKYGIAPDMWKQHERTRLTPTQKVAFYRGLVAGIVAVTGNSASDPVAAR